MSKKNPPTSTSIIADLVKLVCTPNADDNTKSEAIKIAYEIGKGEGRVDGAKSMGERLVASIATVRP